MAPYNSELVRKNKEKLLYREKESAYSLLDSFLKDLNTNLQEYYTKGFNSREQFIEFMDELIILKHDDIKTVGLHGFMEHKDICGKQEFYKIIREKGDFKIKQLVSFSRSDLQYFSTKELAIVKTEYVIGEQGEDNLDVEKMFNALNLENENLLACEEGTDVTNLKSRYYTLLEADLPRINGGFIEYFEVVEEE